MKTFAAQELAWYHAATLAERVAVGRPDPRWAARGDEARARFRLQSWKSQAPFAAGSYFEQRLAADGLDESSLADLLVEPPESLQQRFREPPAWLVELDAALSRPLKAGFEALLGDKLRNRPSVGFLLGAAPLFQQGVARLGEGIEALRRRVPVRAFDPSTVVRILFASLPNVLFDMTSRAMVLELNIARLEGQLEGDTPGQRFSSFLDSLRRPERVRSILREYPVLARLLLEQAERWARTSLEFLERLCLDWPALEAAFAGGRHPGVLVEVVGNLSDTHRDGRSVLIARFASGLRVVYKPKSLAVDAHFQELLQWLNALGADPPFRSLALVDRGSHGWVEHVSARECESVEEVGRFYLRQGGYLALLYALEATDFHRGNLVASGEHPILIDLEALFHPRRQRLAEEEDAESAADSAHRAVRRAISRSVLHVGLLPERVWSTSESEGVDLSGLSSVAGQLTPHAVPDWEAVGTDAMRVVRKRTAIGASRNLPRLGGAAVNPLDHRQAILDGFRATYELLADHRGELLAEASPLARFAEDEVCVFLRSSRTYRRLLRESYHPDVLRDALDRDRLFDLLWAGVEQDRDLARVVPSERAELWRGDVPQFGTRPGSRDLWTGSGERLRDFFEEPSLSAGRRRVEQLGADDFERQAWFVEASLSTLPGADACWPTCALGATASAAGPERLLAAACAVGDRLAALAIQAPEDASWLGLQLERERLWSIAPCGLDLYGGLPGAAIFLAYLGAVSREERYTRLAQSVVTALLRRIEKRRSSITRIGGFDGWGGVIHVLCHLGVLWDRRNLLAEAEALVELLPDLVERDQAFDVVSGAAGCIAGLRSLQRCAPSDRVTAAAAQCGDRLLAAARQMQPGLGWPARHSGGQALSGFAHGVAGIAWSLLALHAWTGAERFRSAAREAMAYERSLFDAEAGNWRDLREQPSGPGETRPGFATTWCHGAPGIGLARLQSLPLLDDPLLGAEIDVALRTTLLYGFGRNQSLCHGDLGNLELLQQASQTLGEPVWQAHVSRLASALLDAGEARGWQCGVPFGVETPGLMAGLAGIGYELLRLSDPEQVPCVLILEPPRLPARGGPTAGEAPAS